MHNRNNRDHDRGESTYAAKSLYEATFLFYRGIPLVEITGRPGSCRWVFANKDGVSARAAEEFHSDASVGAKSVFQAMGQLKRQADEVLGRRPVSGKEHGPTTMEEAFADVRRS